MSVWVQIVLGAISLIREYIKLERAKAENKKSIPGRMKAMKDAMKLAREKGDTSEVEQLFRNIGSTKHP